MELVTVLVPSLMLFEGQGVYKKNLYTFQRHNITIQSEFECISTEILNKCLHDFVVCLNKFCMLLRTSHWTYFGLRNHFPKCLEMPLNFMLLCYTS